MTAQSELIAKRVAYLMEAARKPPIASALQLRVDWGYTGDSAARAAANNTGGGSSAGVTSLFEEDFDMEAEESSGTDFKMPPPPDVQQAPSDLREFSLMNRFIMNAIMADTQKIPQNINLIFKLNDGTEKSMQIPVVRIPPVRPPLIHTLAARRIIRELESGDIASLGPTVTDGGDSDRRAEIVKAAAVNFSVNYQVVSKFTAFLAIKKDKGGDEYDLGPDVTISDEEKAFMNQQQTHGLGGFSSKMKPVRFLRDFAYPECRYTVLRKVVHFARFRGPARWTCVTCCSNPARFAGCCSVVTPVSCRSARKLRASAATPQ